MSEIDVLKLFTGELMSVQQQLREMYHTDCQLSDRLLSAVEVPTFQEMIADGHPRTAHQLIERVAKPLSERTKSAASTVAHLTEEPLDDHDTDDHVNHTLGQKYDGDAKLQVKFLVHLETDPGRNSNVVQNPSGWRAFEEGLCAEIAIWRGTTTPRRR